MQRYILTGAPGAGKTVLIRALERAGHAVVEEAATDVIALVTAQGVAEHWNKPSFIDDIASLQIRRQRHADAWADDLIFFDRSPICTWALCEYAGRDPPDALVAEMERIERDAIYQRQVFFIRNLGFITPTEARRISFEDTLRFEAVHADVYRRLGYELIDVPAGAVADRLVMVIGAVTNRREKSVETRTS
ncbi:MAG TPA: AAA family ATPase [Caulobacteraceae bacterium]|nr:AAA family ATPase [Caulobacteraceae bacterium]